MFGWDDFSNLAGAVGGIASGALSYFGQNSANQTNRDINTGNNQWNFMQSQINNAFNAQQAELNRQFQERMSGSAWQRGVADMEKAGINPILAFGKGGASTPSGGQASGAAIPGQTGAAQVNPMAGATAAFNSAIQARLARAQLANIVEDTDKKRSEKFLTDQLKYKAQTEMALTENNAKIAAQNLSNLRLALPGLKTESEIDSSMLGKVARYAQRLNPFASSASSLKNAFSPVKRS